MEGSVQAVRWEGDTRGTSTGFSVVDLAMEHTVRMGLVDQVAIPGCLVMKGRMREKGREVVRRSCGELSIRDPLQTQRTLAPFAETITGNTASWLTGSTAYREVGPGKRVRYADEERLRPMLSRW